MTPQKKKQAIFGPAPAILAIVRLFFGSIGNLAPSSALKVLWRLIFYTRRKAFKPPHNEIIKTAKVSKFKVRVDKIELPVVDLTAYRWGKSDKKIFLIHGWEAHSLDFYKMIPRLTEAGFEVIAFDAPAHGKSEGTEVNLIAVKQSIHQAILRFGIPYAIIGHSFGGYASSFTLSEYPIKVEKFIMIASPIYGHHMFEIICNTLGVPEKLKNRLFEALKQRFGRTIQSFNIPAIADRIKAKEIHYIYDQGDEMVALEDVESLLEAAPFIKATQINGVGHFKMPRNEEVIDKVVEVLIHTDQNNSDQKRFSHSLRMPS